MLFMLNESHTQFTHYYYYYVHICLLSHESGCVVGFINQIKQIHMSMNSVVSLSLSLVLSL